MSSSRHFGLTHKPFERALEPDELFASSAVCEVQVRLPPGRAAPHRAGHRRGRFGQDHRVPPARRHAATLHPGLHRLFYVPLSTGNVMDMYKAIAWQLGRPVERNRAAAYRTIHTEVCRLAVECRIHPVLVVDEAQHLRNDGKRAMFPVLADDREMCSLPSGSGGQLAAGPRFQGNRAS